MFDEKVILARLQKGDSAQEIANEFADLLNKANKDYITQKEKEAEAAKIQKEKETELAEILNNCAKWCQKYYGTNDALATEIFGTGGVKELIADLDTLYNLGKNVKVKVKTASPTADDVIADFLKMMKW